MKPQIGWLLYLLALLLFVSAQDSIAQGEAVECAPFHAAATAAGGFCLFPDLPELNFINEIEGDEAGRIWIGTDGRGLTMWQEGELRNWQPETSEMREDAIRGFAVRDGVAVSGLFGCGGCGGVGVYDIASDEWRHYYPDESELSTGGVGGVALDTEGRIYMPAASGEMHVLDGTEWQHFPAPTKREEFQSLSDSTDAIFDSHGTLWVGYSSGLYALKDEAWSRVSGFPSVVVNALAYDENRDLIWVATNWGILFGNENVEWTAVPPLIPTGMTAEMPMSVEDVTVDTNGYVWAIDRSALGSFNGREWEIFEPSLISDGSIGSDSWGESLSFDLEGNLWLGYSSFGHLAVFPEAVNRTSGTVVPIAEIESAPVPLLVEPEMPLVMVDPFAGMRAVLMAAVVMVLCVGGLMVGGIFFYLRRSAPRKSG